MKDEVQTANCGRENDLIAFLYGELDPGERSVFSNHMQECRSCGAELSEFSSLRESVVAWRDEALAGVTSPAIQASAPVRAESRQPTALTALREFFNLSPLWMKGAVVFASLLFCLFTVLAAARLRDPTPAPVGANPNVKAYSPQELNAIVEQRVKDELQRLQSASVPEPKASASATGGSDQVFRRKPQRVSEVASAGPQQKARRPLSKVERQQLAADLRLIDNTSDGELDLLDDRLNQ